MLNKLNNKLSNGKEVVKDKMFNAKYDIKEKAFDAKINYVVMDKKEVAKKGVKIITGAAAITTVKNIIKK